jgi:hypothetical protein
MIERLRAFFVNNNANLARQLDNARILPGTILARQNQDGREFDPISNAGFKVFSQFGEDGIIQYLIDKVPCPKTFIEFGVENYAEANTRFLLIKDNWRGLVIDPDPANIEYIRRDEIFWKHSLTAIQEFVTPHNVNGLFEASGFSGDIGLLSVDIDGNDYHVWDAINVVTPAIVITEYNSVFGPDHAITIPYQDNFDRRKAHYSHLYFGASLKALNLVAERKDYALVGCTKEGLNAFFVRRDLLGTLRPLTVKEAYVECTFRESRDETGRLDYLSGAARLHRIADMPVVNLETGETQSIGMLMNRVGSALSQGS